MDNLQTDAYNQIKYKIVHFDYIPGQKISEKTISTNLGLGRTPVREALIRIEREGLIEVIPQSGTYITKINLNTAQEGRFVRECIEPEVMAEASVRLDDNLINQIKFNLQQQKLTASQMDPDGFFDLDQEFHKLFYTITDHKLVWDWMEINNTQLNRFRRLRLKQSHLDWRTLLNQHNQIFEVMASRDLSDLKYVMSHHLHLMLEEQDMVVGMYPDYFE